ncbi:N-formylglutamate amidohydrolase [Halalkalibaculum sp. DA3122]|uniref:N-formylglutamate amidohydrolase n=1 Tax=Halalkalibaculum sp. DA3122 TaxID=3373607 RepID=UPI00375468B3
MDKELIITCEHAGNEVPSGYRSLFEDDPEILKTHRGYDIGALELTRTCARKLKVSPYLHSVTRLLVDLNRSLHSPELFSEFMESLDEKGRQMVLEQYYKPHRNTVEAQIEKMVSKEVQVLHVSVHTFTPILDGSLREVDIGLLFDPSRSSETRFCHIWKRLLERDSDLNIQFNNPYPGVMDGFSTYLRTKYTDSEYAGLEIEVNQKFPENRSSGKRWSQVQELVAETLREAYQEWRAN